MSDYAYAASVAGCGGRMGLLIVSAFVGIYILAIRNMVRHQPDRVFQHIVTNIYLIALLHLWGVYFMCSLILNPEKYSECCGSISNFWLNSEKNIELSFFLIVALIPLALITFLTKPQGMRVMKPAGISGAIMSLLGAFIVNLYILSTIYTRAYHNLARSFSEQESRHRNIVKELKQKIEAQNQRIEHTR